MDIPSYEPAAALDFFKAGGEVETIPAGRIIFREDRRSRRALFARDKMYLLLKGRVSLTAGAQEIRAVKAGEIFGEMAALARTPRSATAVAKTPCKVIALDAGQFRKALAKKPAFALMLMKVMVPRLREAVARAKAQGARHRLPQARDHNLHEHEREGGLLGERLAKLPGIERDHFARRFRHGGGAARRVSERRHLAEDFSRLHRADFLRPRGQADPALEQEVHLVAREERAAAPPGFAEDGAARRDRFHLAAGFEEIERRGGLVARDIHRLGDTLAGGRGRGRGHTS